MKKFSFKLTKFKIITAIILFVAIIGPIMIYDDVYFAAPWIWHILAPPLMLEYFFGDAALLIALVLLVVWFYTLASFIEWYRKWK